ncbi:MAG: type I-C CRISPR-associated protein Cas8c/Csd1 [Sulfobacillus sp.]
MILQSLVEYYRRLSEAQPGEVPREGFQQKEIDFLIDINETGDFIGLVDLRELEGKQRRGRACLVPREEKRSGMNASQTANLLWDHEGYVLGVLTQKAREAAAKKGDRQKDPATKILEQTTAFKKRIEDAFPNTAPPSIQAVLAFLHQSRLDDVSADPLWPDISDKGGNLTFRIHGHQGTVCDDPEVIAALSGNGGQPGKEETAYSQCLVLGIDDEIRTLHNPIKGVWGAQTSGANIVSFNQPSFRSYGKEQGMNAPVGQRAEFAYVTALNRLLARDSRQRIQVGDASTVFWAERANPMEDLFGQFFGIGSQTESDQDLAAIRELYESTSSGRRPIDEDLTRFYVLGLAPNAARIAIRFWHAGTVGRVAVAIRQHFEDCALVRGPQDREYYSVFQLLTAVSVQGKADNIEPNLAGNVMRAVLEGTPYPRTLLGAAIRRLRAEREITRPRVVLIKAVLTRQARYQQAKERFDMALDRSNSNPAYRLGRLFAVLERVQERANPGINATIRDRFYGSASSSPGTAFPLLLKLKNHHISKIESRGLAVHFEREIGEIVDGLPSRFPSHLNLDDQGRFAIGYYHQRQDFYAKKERPESGVEVIV